MHSSFLLVLQKSLPAETTKHLFGWLFTRIVGEIDLRPVTHSFEMLIVLTTTGGLNATQHLFANFYLVGARNLSKNERINGCIRDSVSLTTVRSSSLSASVTVTPSVFLDSACHDETFNTDTQHHCVVNKQHVNYLALPSI